ncbi:CrcB family protein [Nocardioides lijunqiniae]|uniref:CrcB family protein n=1 Tax=Nocardioides lijunqiniae TaxID=2760832 RepID=UPI001878D40E
MTALLVALGGGVGAALRFLVGRRLDRELPLGTLLVNVAGSLLLGVLSGLALDGDALALLGTGFCGGLTTYSAFAVQTHALGRRGAAYAAVTVLAALGACGLGFWLGLGLAQA